MKTLEVEELVNTTSGILDKFNQAECLAVSSEAGVNFTRSLSESGFIEFGVFACPTINARLLLSSIDPEAYISTDPSGCSLEKGGKDQRMNKLFMGLRKIGIAVMLRIIIGDTDEEDYIFPVVPPAMQLNPMVIEQRRSKFSSNLQERARTRLPWQQSVDRYSEISALFEDRLPLAALDDPQTKRDLSTEMFQMKQVYNPGGYYEGLPLPSESQIRQATELKFQTYARQGRRLVQMYPNLVLIQNEFPLLIRTRMLNLLSCQMGLPILPAVYPLADRRGKNE